MTFVTPILLGGAIFVGIPIALHLIMRQQPKQLRFPAVRFIQASREANRRRLRLRHLLLLALRCAAIVLLALALARPSIQGTGLLGGQEAPVAATLVFDTSPRMDYQYRNQARLEVAQEMALWLLKQLPEESDVAVLSSHSPSLAFAVDRGAAKQRIERLTISPSSRPLISAVNDALQLVHDSDKPRKEIYVFSDLARSSWSEDAMHGLRKQLESSTAVGLYLIDVGVKEPVNVGLGELRLSGQILAKNSPLQVAVDLWHLGPESQRSVELFLQDERKQPQKRGHVTADWKEGEPTQVEFPSIALGEGTHQGFVRILGDDGLVWDDTRYFTVDVKRAWRVLVATPQPKHAIFFTEALAPAPMREAGQARFQCQVIPIASLPEQRLDDYAAICLLDPPPLAADTWRQLANYVNSGNSLAVFLGRNAKPAKSLNTPDAQQLLPGLLKRQWRDPSYLTEANLQHPIFAKFRAAEGTVPWQAFPVFKYWQIDEGSTDVNVLMRYVTGHAALLEKPVGRGRVVTMTTPVSDPPSLRGRDPWNVLPTGAGVVDPWPFLMLSNELMLYLVGSTEQRFNYTSGDTVVLPLDANQRVPMVLLETPTGDRIKQTVDLKQGAVVLTSTDGLGNYRVRAGGESDGLDSGFSINLAPQATQLERLTEQELTEGLGADAVQIARNRQQIDRSVNIGRVGRELFPYLIFVVATVMGLEHLLSNRFYRDQP